MNTIIYFIFYRPLSLRVLSIRDEAIGEGAGGWGRKKEEGNGGIRTCIREPVQLFAEYCPLPTEEFSYFAALYPPDKWINSPNRATKNSVTMTTITMPLNKTFWESCFGMLTDKFGINWMVSCPLPSAKRD